MLRWPTRARGALVQLFRPLQEIDVYVEDENDEAFYRRLLNFATDNEVKIARVFGLGGRSHILAQAAAHDFNQRRALFIADGDLPWVRGDAPVAIPGLHQHEAYCVENLLLCEDAIATLVSEELAKTEAEAKTLFSYEDFKKNIGDPLSEIFAAFSASHLHAPRLPTLSGGSCMRIFSDKKPRRLDPNKALTLVNEILDAAKVECGNPAAVDQTYWATLARIRSLPDPLLCVSGKDYLLPILKNYLHDIGVKPLSKSLRFRLADTGRKERLAHIASSLRNSAAARAP